MTFSVVTPSKTLLALVLSLFTATSSFAMISDESSEKMGDHAARLAGAPAASSASASAASSAADTADSQNPFPLLSLPKDLIKLVISSLSPNNQGNFASVSHAIRQVVWDVRIKPDPKKLAARKWGNGPQIDTIENYVFNKIDSNSRSEFTYDQIKTNINNNN